MKKFAFTLASATLLAGLALGSGSATAAPMGPTGLQSGQDSMTQVRMTHSDRMMMKKRMMRKQMMHRRMMRRGM